MDKLNIEISDFNKLFEFIQQLGAGAFAMVVAVIDKSNDEERAIKVDLINLFNQFQLINKTKLNSFEIKSIKFEA